MTTDGPYQMSQGLEVLRPKSGRAYPIPCDEWILLKRKIERLTLDPWLFQSIGLLLLGAALSTFVTIITGTFQLPQQQRALDLAWATVAVTGICGTVCLFFAHKERGVHRIRAADVVAEMELIEKRYDSAS